MQQVLIYFRNENVKSLYKESNLKPQTRGSVAIDLISPETVEIENVLDTYFIDFGISIKVPQGYFAMIVPRSSTFKKFGIIQTNHCGIIDSDYCGEKDFLGMNIQCTKKVRDDIYASVIDRGDRIAQLLILPLVQFEFVPQEKHWGDESRGGFGSTGK